MAHTPNLDKLVALGDERQTVQDFIDWMCETYEHGISIGGFMSDRERERIMARYFGIDLVKVEEERMALLAELRQTNHMRTVLKKRKDKARA